MRFSRTQKLVLIGFVLALVAMPVLAAFTGNVEVDDGTPYGSPSGMNVTLTGDTQLDGESLFPNSNSVELNTSDGNITFTAAGTASATVDKSNITGTYTNVTSIDASSNNVSINPEDKSNITVGSGINWIEFRDGNADDGNVDYYYDAGSTVNVTVRGLSANAEYGAVDQQNNEVEDTSTSDSSGTVTFVTESGTNDIAIQTNQGGPTLSNLKDDGSTRFENTTLTVDLNDPDMPDDNVTLDWYVDGNVENTTTHGSNGTYSAEVGPFADGDHDYHVEATDAYGSTDSTNTQTFTIDHYDPQVTNLAPDGELDSRPSTASADINDTDFASGQDGDSITVTFYVNGSQIDQKTTNSNGTVSTNSMPDLVGGQHTLKVNATDEYGQTTNESTTFSVPDDLYVREENNHSALVPSDGEIQFFGSDEVYSKTAPNGIANLTGLPVDQPFIVQVEPTDSQNYTTRTIYIESIYEQQSVYVLNTSATSTVESRFELDDPTGQFDSETLLKIQKPINVSGNVSYQIIVADEFGVEGITATLDQDQRYELVVSSDSDTQSVGPYRASVGETVQVRPGSAEIQLPNGTAPFRYNATIENDTITYKYNDPQNQTDSLKIFIHERGNKSNTAQANQSFVDLGTVSGTATIPADETDKEWVVEFIVDRNNNEFTKPVYLSNRKGLLPDIDDGWASIIGIGLLLLLAGAFSVLNAGVGAVIVSLFGGLLYFIGFLSGATSAAAVAMALMLSIIGHALSGSR